jgi:Fic family protein
MVQNIQGTLTNIETNGESYKIYLPNPLPPQKIDLEMLVIDLEQANKSIGQLNGTMGIIPNPSIINYMYVRKEAVLSSQIEGTQSTLNDLLKYESGILAGLPLNDVAEVSSYVNALDYGLKRLKTLPLSLRLIREVHYKLLKNSRGETKSPGEFRTSQNWIGGSRPGNANFVPVDPARLMDTLSSFEKFMNSCDKIPILIKTALIHYQFETIHPFLDGNGRIGRLLITLYLYEKKFLKAPCLYMSLYFKKNRYLYYEYLNTVRYNGSWEQWIKFFLNGITETANDAQQVLKSIQNIFTRDENFILQSNLKRAENSTTIVFEKFKQKPMLTISELVKLTKLSKPTVIKSVNHLIKLGILKPSMDRSWRQVYVYQKYIDELNY